MGQRTGRCRFYLLNAVYSLVEAIPFDDGRPAGRLKRLLKSGILKFLSSKRDALCVALSFGSLSAFNVRQGKEPFLHQVSPGLLVSRGD